MKWVKWAFLSVCLLLSIIPALAQIRTDTLLLNADVKLNVRSGPGAIYDVIGVAKPGEIYTVIGKEGGWYQIDFLGRAGYVVDHLVTVSGAIPRQSEAEIASGVGFTARYRINLRAGPGTWYQRLDVVPAGASVSVIGRTYDTTWLQVVYLGTTGWVAARYGSISGNIYGIFPLP